MMPKPTDSPRASRRCVTFSVAGRTFALALERICTITRYEAVRPVAPAPDYIRGVTVEGGRVVPVVDVALRLGLKPFRNTPHACVIVVRLSGTPVGLAVDDVGPIVTEISCSRARARRATDPPPPQILELEQLLDRRELMRLGEREAAPSRAGAAPPAP